MTAQPRFPVLSSRQTEGWWCRGARVTHDRNASGRSSLQLEQVRSAPPVGHIARGSRGLCDQRDERQRYWRRTFGDGESNTVNLIVINRTAPRA